MQPEGTSQCSSAAPNPTTDTRIERPLKPITRSSESTVSQYPMGSGHEECNCGTPGEGCKCNEPSMRRYSASSYIYAIGRIEARFPRLGVEKEFVQATGRSDAVGLTDRDALRSVLSKRENRYLVRQICWVFTIEGLETYILKPNDPSDYDQLIESLRPAPRPTDIDVIIGHRGPTAPQDMCRGLTIPIVMLDQLYSFDIDGHIKALPKPEKIESNKFKQAAEELLFRIMQMADNTGGTDEHRALNYLAVRYHEIYKRTAEAFAENSSLTSVEVKPSRLSGVRKIFDIIFSFTNRQTDVVDKYFVRVDVTEEFPFLVTKMSHYYDR
jgi:cyclic patellamide precursor peptide PatG